MILEKQLEDRLISHLSTIPELSSSLIIGSRLTGATIHDIITENDNVDTIIAVHTGYRQNDAFSLSPVTVTIAISINTRIEKDKSAQHHEMIVEKISDKLSYWHKFSNDFTFDFSDLPNIFCGELRLTGGSGRIYDGNKELWTDSITFSIRGSEKFNNN